MNVIEILMRRDGLTREEATWQVKHCREHMLNDVDDAADIIMDDLGLEPDYIEDILFF